MVSLLIVSMARLDANLEKPLGKSVKLRRSETTTAVPPSPSIH
jgi:hypothetical protein